MDWKLAGYLISSIGVLLLGGAAWPGLEPYKLVLLLAGMLSSVLGMACRYRAHRKEKAAIAYAQREAERKQ